MGRHRRQLRRRADGTYGGVVSALMESSSKGHDKRDPAGEPLRALVAGFPGAAVHLRGQTIWFNSFAQALIGYEISELANVDEWFAVVFKGYEPQVREVYERSRQAGFPQPDVLTITRKDGAERLVEFSGYTGAGEEVWFMRDLTDARRAEEALHDREQRLEVAVEVAGLGTWEWDVATGRMVGDETAQRLFGVGDKPEQATYETYIGRVHSDDRSRLKDAIEPAIEARSSFDAEVRVRHDATRSRWLHVRGTVAEDEAGQHLRVVGAVQDIDDHKRLDEHLIHAARMESLGQLAGGIAHDFNNLLVVIKGHLEFAAAEPGLPVGLSQRLHSIESAVARGADMVSSLMQLGRSDATTAGTVDVNAWLEAGVGTLRQLVGEDIGVEYQLDASSPFVKLGEARLAAVVLNLASNARDAMPAGGVLRITTRDVSLQRGSPEGADLPAVQLVIEDTGIGMDRATRDRIFEPFFTTKAPGVGTGLGLASVYGAVLDAGGEIDVASSPGEGSTFTIFLPTVSPAPGIAERTPRSVKRPVQEGLIMVAEDDAEVLELTADILRSAGYRVLEALGPNEALEFVASGERPDLLLADVVMPNLSGPALAARLADQLPNLPVLYMSGYASEGRAGVKIADDDLIRKPFSHGHLLERVAQRLPCREE